MDSKLPKVSFPDDPRRCTSIIGNDQCPHIRVPGHQTCERHCSGAMRIARSNLSNYKFSEQFHGRIGDFAASEDIKSLRGEIGVCRLLLQSVVNQCRDDLELSMQADRIARLADNLNRLITSCHKLETSTGQLLDKTVVINIGGMIVNVLDKYIEDKALLGEIGNEIYENITTVTRPENLGGMLEEFDHNGKPVGREI